MPSPKPSADKTVHKKGTSRVTYSGSGPRHNAPRSKLRNLTYQQRAFVEAVASGESVYAASLRAGYKDRGAQGYELMKDPDVLELVASRKAAFEKQTGMTRQKVMDGLLEAAEMAKLMAEPSSMVAAWREIGKMCGYYAPVEKKIKIEGNVVLDKMERLTEAELLELVQGAQAQLSKAIHDDEDDDDEIPAPGQAADGAPALEFDAEGGADD